MEVLESVPQPAYSDGNEEAVKVAAARGLVKSRGYVEAYFRQVVQTIKDMFLRYPGEMAQKRMPGTFTFSPNAQLDQLPRNYELFTDPQSGNLLIAGHPRLKQLILADFTLLLR